jgi:hypothetical protein
LKVAWAKMTANSKKIAIDNPTIAGVLLRFFAKRFGGATAGISNGSLTNDRKY